MSGFDRTPSSQTARPLTRIAPPIQLPPVVHWPVPVALPSGPITSMEDCSSAPHHGLVFLDVVAERARLVHQEHGSIELAHGAYFVWRQREYDPSRWDASGRAVLD